MPPKLDIKNQIFGYLTAIEPERYDPIGHSTYWKCQCACGNIISVSRGNLLKGHTKSCGCQSGSFIRSKKFIDITNQRFGKLLAIKCVEYKNHRAHWLCKCDCGNELIVRQTSLTTGNTISCGCFKGSKGEEQITKILLDNNIRFQRQYSFDDLKQKRKLKFDFAIFNYDNILSHLVEYQGEQHYKETSYYHSPELIESDNMKVEYCKENNIPLIIIPYSQTNITIDLLLGEYYGL